MLGLPPGSTQCLSCLEAPEKRFLPFEIVTAPTAVSILTHRSFLSSIIQSDEHNESITFRLVHPVCLVTAIQLRPFMAWFQAPKNPIYAPKSIRIRIGGIQCFDRSGQPKILQECCKAAEADLLTDDAKRAAHAFADHTLQSGTSTSPPSLSSSLDSNITLELTSGERLRRGPVCSATERGTWDGWQWISPELPVEKVDELQTFRIPPTVCLGGYLRIDLIGKTETQDIDERFYSELTIFFISCWSPAASVPKEACC